ncbi:MAG: DNA topoisomerase VI subunit B [Pirellulaceae bacterium]|nr:DNA topoisomerase VI subunit B [Pirellulaceae bacterium]
MSSVVKPVRSVAAARSAASNEDDSSAPAAKGSAYAANGAAANGQHRADEAHVADHDANAADGGDANSVDGGERVQHDRGKRRATAESMAAKQRDISVSEFFAKNRHLLGFDNPRKALLTTVKEAVDNSLDACEEAGIVPEIWVTIEPTGNNRFKVSVQDNGPGIVKKQIPLIFGKLLYGSKFHRLRMSRGQQGIGISAAGMYGMLTTGKPVKIISKLAPKKPAHYFELQIDTKRNQPEIINGKGDGVDVEGGKDFHERLQKHGIDWETHYRAAEGKEPQEVKSGTRVTIELEGKFIRGRGSVGEYLEQTAIANPHVTLHYKDAEGNDVTYERSTTQLPPEPKEIKPHPYGVELGRLVTMLKDTPAGTISAFLTDSFSRVSSSVARNVCETAKISTRMNPRKVGRQEADALYQSIQNTRISAPATDCLVPIGEQLILKGLHQVVPGEFYCAATRPPAVYRGNPFLIEVGLAYGGVSTAQKVSLEALTEMLGETDARTLRQFLMNSFDGIGSEGADKIMTEAKMGTRQSPSRLAKNEIAQLHAAMRNVNLSEGQSMQVLRYANRVPLQFQPAACAITQSVIATNWRSYGLSQSRGNLPQGPVTVMVHMASVWVPFTSESKEAIAGYPEIQKELRLGLQAVGRKLGIYLNRRMKVKQEGERRSIFLRYLGEVAGAVAEIRDLGDKEQKDLYDRLLHVAKRRTAEADTKLDDRGKKVQTPLEEELGDNVLIVEQDAKA